MNDIEMPEEFADVLSEVAHAYYRLREPLTDRKITDTWIDGMKAATRLAYGHAKAWNGKFPRPLPYVIEGPCPLGHRTADEYDDASIRLVIRQESWWSYDPASPCPKCTAADLRRWMMTCPRCVAGEDSERHYPFHAPLDAMTLYDLSEADYTGKPQGFEYTEITGGGFDASPAAWVMREFVRLGREAAARWWLEHTEEAADAHGSRRLGEGDRQRFVSDRLEWARGVLETVPKSKKAAISSKPMMTAESGAAWLDKQGVEIRGEKATWAEVKDMPGCPAQAVIYAAVKLRKSRTTES